jgi:hypothetical protein
MHVSPICQKKTVANRKKDPIFLICSVLIYFSDSNDNNTASNSTLNVPGSSKRSNSPNSAISALTSIPTAPLLTTDYRNLNSSTKTGLGKSKN